MDKEHLGLPSSELRTRSEMKCGTRMKSVHGIGWFIAAESFIRAIYVPCWHTLCGFSPPDSSFIHFIPSSPIPVPSGLDNRKALFYSPRLLFISVTPLSFVSFLVPVVGGGDCFRSTTTKKEGALTSRRAERREIENGGENYVWNINGGWALDTLHSIT